MSQRPRTEVEADLAAARAARSALFSGPVVTETTRDGRSMKFAHLTIRDLNTAISDLTAELAALPEFDGGERPRLRRAIGLSWKN